MKKIIALNHKSMLSYDEIIKFKNEYSKIDSEVELILFPTTLYLSLFKDYSKEVGAQNFYTKSFGSYTGEITLDALSSLGINTVLVGHSERRGLFHETKEEIKEKLKISLDNNFKTVLCVGEDTKTDKSEDLVLDEVKYFLENINDIKNLVIAYEPRWAIGSTETQTYDMIEKVVLNIKNFIKNKYNYDIAVLYGGSVKSDSADIIRITDGLLLGRSSTTISSVKEIIKKAKEPY